MFKLILIVCAFFGAVYLVSKINAAHAIAFTVVGIPFTWVALAGLAMFGFVAFKVTVK